MSIVYPAEQSFALLISMIQSARHLFNQTFTPERYQALLDQIETDFPGQLGFRVAETPVFVPKVLTDKLLQASSDIIDVITRDDFRALTEAAIPDEQRVPNEQPDGRNAHANFLVIDFAVCRDTNGELMPQLIEMQGFPSLNGFQPYLASQFRAHYPIPENLSHLFTVGTNEDFNEAMRSLIVGDADPDEVILLELFPDEQKTRIDFSLTEKMLGIRTVNLTDVQKEGRNLFYEKDGERKRIRRIYNRIILDDLRNFPDLQTDFNLTDDVDVEWVGHPNWFFRISKYALPLLKSPYVPVSYRLSELTQIPDDLDSYVLKPLFSFAGSGVNIHVTQSDIDAIPDEQRSGYLLQKKVQYEPVIESPDGLVKCEIRMMFIWPDNDERPTLITNLARLSRGEMIGVSFNKDKDWVGGSVGFFEK